MNARPASRSLKVDSTFTIRTDQPVNFEREGLYFFIQDTIQTEGIGFLVVNDRFPKMTFPQQLVSPLMYMSTNAEIKELQSAKDFKKSLDKYWLTLMAGNQDLARAMISNYYKRVEEANQLFTSYKEGWKTDKGMIYIILGNPDKVQRGKDREVWVYNQRASANNINFTFNRRTNQFVQDHYELVRYQEYQPIWYPLVESWRTGAIR
jgi:GWxTD domain-containing protein